jgi:hypothetical protein
MYVQDGKRGRYGKKKCLVKTISTSLSENLYSELFFEIIMESDKDFLERRNDSCPIE